MLHVECNVMKSKVFTFDSPFPADNIFANALTKYCTTLDKMAITSVCIIAISVVAMLLMKAGPVESRPRFCPKCTSEEKDNCPVVVANATCTVVQMEDCSCCPTACAGRKGDYCGSGKPPCDEKLKLICLPPRYSEPDYMFDLVPQDSNAPSFINGDYICQQLLPEEADYVDYEGPGTSALRFYYELTNI